MWRGLGSTFLVRTQGFIGLRGSCGSNFRAGVGIYHISHHGRSVWMLQMLQYQLSNSTTPTHKIQKGAGSDELRVTVTK